MQVHTISTVLAYIRNIKFSPIWANDLLLVYIKKSL